MIGGSGIANAATGMFNAIGAVGNQDVTTVGFQPELVFFLAARIQVDPPGTSADSGLAFGVATGAGNPTDYVWLGGSNDGELAMITNSYSLVGESIAIFNGAAAGPNDRGEVDAWLSNGFSLDWKEVNTNPWRIHFLAIDGGQWAVGDVLSSATTGNYVETGVGFRPVGALFVSHDRVQSTVDTVQPDDQWSMGATTGPSNQRAQCITDEDAALDSDVGTSVQHDDVYCNLNLNSVIEGMISLVSFDADGFTYSVTVGDGSNFVWYLAIAGAGGVNAIATGSFNVPTALGGTVTVSGLLFQPKAMQLWWSGRTETTDTAGTATHQQGIGFGVSTTDRRAVCSQSQDAAATSAPDKGHRADAVACTIDTAGAWDGLLDIQSINADGATFVTDDTFAAAVRVHYLMVGGPAITNAATGQFIESAAIGNQDVTTVGFQPELVFFSSIALATDPPALGIGSRLMFGVATGAGNPTDYVWSGGSQDAVATMQTMSYSLAGESIAVFNANSNSMVGRAEVDAWLSNGFSLDWKEISSTYRYHYLAIDGGQWAVGDVLTQTNTANFAETGVGFRPVGALFVSHNKAQSVADTPQDHEEWSMGATTGASDQRAQCLIDEDAVADADVGTSVQHDDLYCNLDLNTAIEGLMSLVSFDSDGFTLAMDDADPSQAFVWYLAIAGMEASKDSAFKDGASVAVPTVSGTIDSITTTLPAGNNLVIAVIQLDNTAAAIVQIAAGNMDLVRTGTPDVLLSENENALNMPVTGGVIDGQYFYLIGRDAGASANEAYRLVGFASATGLNAEIKFIIINGPTNSVYGESANVAVGTAETTILDVVATGFPAASVALPNIIVSVIQHTSTANNPTISAGNLRLNRLSPAAILASNQFVTKYEDLTKETNGKMSVLIAIDTTAGAGPTYRISAFSALTGGSAEAKMFVFRGFGAKFTDTGSVPVGTTRTVIGSVATDFAAGDDIVFGVFQNEWVADANFPAGGTDTRLVGGAADSSNAFAFFSTPAGSTSGRFTTFFGLPFKKTTTVANPTYEGAMTASVASAQNGELKILAIHIRDRVEYDVQIQIWDKTTDTVRTTIGECLDVTTFGADIQCLISGVAAQTIAANEVVRLRVAHSSGDGTVAIEYDDADATGDSRVTLPIPEFEEAALVVASGFALIVPIASRAAQRRNRLRRTPGSATARARSTRPPERQASRDDRG